MILCVGLYTLKGVSAHISDKVELGLPSSSWGIVRIEGGWETNCCDVGYLVVGLVDLCCRF